VVSLKDIELQILAELMKNSRRSDRELARAVGSSQPTITRTRRKLEKEGYINEFTIIPNFNKIGYHLFALTFFTWKKGLSAKEMEEARSWAVKQAASVPPNVVLIERGLGLGYDSFMASFHKDYTSYATLMNDVKKNKYLEASKVESFIVNLDDELHYRYLTFSTLGNHLLTMKKQEKK
jgi:DNA-binding Lrp family transcriptional regulator